MRDSEMRAAVSQHIEARVRDREYLLVPEVDVRWSVPGRLDAMMIADRITGFELKSEADSLARLPRQIHTYGAVAERAVLVVAPRHLQAGLAAAPAWWSVWAAIDGIDGVKLRQVQRGKLNPGINLLAVLSFLPRETILAELQRRGRRELSGLRIDELRAEMYRSVPRAQLLNVARTHMLARKDWHRRALAYSRGPGPVPAAVGSTWANYGVPGGGGEAGRES